MSAIVKRVFVVGVGMTKFLKPGRPENPDYPGLVTEAVSAALNDAKVKYTDIQQAVAGYCYGESSSGQRGLYDLQLTGIPIFNVNNNCSTGSSALLLARNLVLGGSDCVLAVGFEKMMKGSLQQNWGDRASPFDRCMQATIERYGVSAAPFAAQMFGNAGREHMEKYGTKREHFAKIAMKNHKHSSNNPNSQFQEVYTLEQILASPEVHEPLTKLQCCPTSDGAAAAIIVSESFVKRYNLQSQAVEILSIEMSTDIPESFKNNSCISAVGYDMSKRAADAAYRHAGVGPSDVQVIELHDCFSANELITYEALGLCPPGKAGELIDKGDNTYGGRWVVNPSGGLISKGHPLGATGLAQCAELCWQLRSLAGPRQVQNAKVALQHNIGLGGAAVVAVYRLGFASGNNKNAPTASSSGGQPNKKFKSYPVFEEIRKALADSSKAESITKEFQGRVLAYCLRSSDGTDAAWVLDFKGAKPTISWSNKLQDGVGDCVISVSDEDFYALATGKLQPQKAFVDGKIKIRGNMAIALKLQNIMKLADTSKL